MIKGIGVDMVELSGIKDLMSDKFIDHVLSTEEKKMFENIPVEETKLSYIGGIFAAKEALFKALKSDKITGLYRDVSILQKESGTSYIVSDLIDPSLNVHVTISHTDNYTVAFVVIENTK